MSAIKVYRDAPIPAGATAPVGLRVPDWTCKLWNSLQRAGMRRAARHLEALANSHAAGNPERAAMLRETAADCRRSAARLATARIETEGSTS